jgi:hypothetical protein
MNKQQRQRQRSFRLAGLFLASVLVAACASSGSTDDAGTGGASATGGNGTGGETAKGGATGAGGTTGTGGIHGSGGTIGSGGTTGTGGAGGTGGASSGGTTGSGGNATGGKGGSTGTGGAAGGLGTGGFGTGGKGGQGGHGTGGAAGGLGTGGAVGTGGNGGTTASYDPCPTNGDPCKVLPLGDSITYGLITVTADQASSDPSINGKDSHGGYRVELYKKAVAGNKNITFVGSQMNGPTMAAGTTVPFPKSHEGWSGYTISMILAKAMANDASYKPHIVLLHAGTNDTYMSDPSGAPSRLSSAVDSLTTEFPDALIVVAKIIPYPSQAANVNLINQSISSMVQSKVAAGKHVVMADLNTGFQTSTMLSGDGVHPNQTGYDWMGDTWYAAISSLLPGS